jgi:outer membrane usher protein
LRVGASGGLVLADGHLFATRRVDESFAVAEVPGYGGVGIGIGSNVLTKTGADGVALIPRLLPYISNSVRIDPKELPINAEIESIELQAVPAWRSGVKLTFPVRGGRGALLKIVLEDGEPAPAGGVVRIAGDPETFYVARRGEAFVTGLKPDSRVVLDWNGRQCALAVNLPPDNPDEIPRIGPVMCRGVPR